MKRALRWLVAVAVVVVAVVGINVALRHMFPVTTVAEVHASPQAYDGHIVGLLVARGTFATSSGETPLTVLQDSSGADMACVGKPLVGTAWVRVRLLRVLGRTLVVGERLPYRNRLFLLAAWVAGTVSGCGSADTAMPPRKTIPTPPMHRGSVVASGSWAGVPVLVVRTGESRSLTLLTTDPAPPVGTEVTFTTAEVAGLPPRVCESPVVVTQLHSLVDGCGRFDGQVVTIEGAVCPGISLLGNQAFGLEDDAGRSVLVLSRDLPEPAAQRVRIRGRVQVLMDSRAAKLVFVHGLQMQELVQSQAAEMEDVPTPEAKTPPAAPAGQGGAAQ